MVLRPYRSKLIEVGPAIVAGFWNALIHCSFVDVKSYKLGGNFEAAVALLAVENTVHVINDVGKCVKLAVGSDTGGGLSTHFREII
jgi:hypothetical protein